MFNEDIKQETRKAHQELEKKVISRLKRMENAEDYGKLLANFYSYFRALEQETAKFISTEILPDIADRRKSERLLHDLETTGHPVSALPARVTIPAIKDHASAMGALYVMEGSVMGGPIIVQMLEKQCGIREGISFFSGYGAETPAMWDAFKKAMNSLAASENAAQTMIDTANETFRHFSELFPEHEQAPQLR